MAESLNELSLEDRLRETARFLDQQRQALGEGIGDLVEPTAGLVIDKGKLIDREHPVLIRAQVDFAIVLLDTIRHADQQGLAEIYNIITASIGRIGTMKRMEYIQHEREDM